MHQTLLKPQPRQNEIYITLDIQEWEVLCQKCKGESFLTGNWWECNKCYGHGKLDWIEKIVGKEMPIQTSGSSSSCSSTQPTKKLNVNHKGGINVNKNIPRSGTLQRFPKVFNKSKRGM